MSDAGPHPHAMLCYGHRHPKHQVLDPRHAQSQGIKLKWRNFLSIAVTQFALTDHLEPLLRPADEEWLRMDSTVIRWLYGSIMPDIADMVMTAGSCLCPRSHHRPLPRQSAGVCGLPRPEVSQH
jgi:hypothetical protein